jgi:DNA-binding NtrC family response regulator
VRTARHLERPVPRVTAELIEALRERQWEGNVRELANLIEALMVRTPGAELASNSAGLKRRASVARDAAYDEHSELAALLVECGGNVARVARRLGKPRSTVRSRISQLGLSRLLPRD